MSSVLITHILVATDFSRPSLSALEQALRIARQLHAKVTVLHVRGGDGPGDMPIADSAAVLTAILGTQPKEIQAEYKAILDRYSDVTRSVLVTDGRVAHAIATASLEVGANLTVVGTRGNTGVKRLLLGSAAERVVRNVESNVMVARPDDDPNDEYQRILVPIDFSEASIHAAETALALASKDTQVVFAHAWHLPENSAGGWAEVVNTGPVAGELRLRLEQKAIEEGNKLVRDSRGKSPAKLSFVYGEGNPIEQIQTWLGESKFDLVVMGSRGNRATRRFLLGSVAEMTVRYAPCSVLVVHRKNIRD